jgi:hypothetical protein
VNPIRIFAVFFIVALIYLSLAALDVAAAVGGVPALWG